MKIKLYKYTPHIESFLNTPMLRATRTNDLNDPFELKPNQELVESIVTNEAPSETALSWLGGSQGFADFKLSYNKGVVALSECHDNLLMWSHYADEHRGGVIEFTFDLENKSHSRTLVQRGLFQELADNNYQYGLVRYRKNRSIDLSMISERGYKLWEQIVDQLGFIKSKDWMYEEEHRFLVDMNYCNKTYVPDNEYSRGRMELFDVSVESVSVGGKNYIVVPPEHILRKAGKHKECEPHLEMFFHNGFAVRAEYLQFVDINPDCITGLYLGAKMKDEQVESILSDTARLAKFQNLKEDIYQAEIHSLNFDLEFKSLVVP
ncbi:DUF2971 domain-containing protein [Vibrio parahaemolyticus]|nr:DUF2971 domain-containing protein [Vibrio parahaemolyticus]